MIQPKRFGKLIVVCGPMFAGKTTELARYKTRADYGGLKTEMFRPKADTRSDGIETHDGVKVRGLVNWRTEWASSHQGSLKPGVKFVGIDEAQFFGHHMVEDAVAWARRGLTVVAAGLDLTFEGKPFGPMPELMAQATEVIKLTSVCHVCKSTEATMTFRRGSDRRLVLVGAESSYEARCRVCWWEGMEQKRFTWDTPKS